MPRSGTRRRAKSIHRGHNHSLLRWRRDRLLFRGVACVAPIFERITPRRGPIKLVLVLVRFLVNRWILPSIVDGEMLAIGRNDEPFRESRFDGAPATRCDEPRSNADRVDNELAVLHAANRMAARSRRPTGEVWMLSTVDVDVPEPTAFRRKDDLVPVDHEVDAARIGVDPQG